MTTKKTKKSPRGIRPRRCCPSPREAKYITVTQDTSPKDKTSICLPERKLEVWGKWPPKKKRALLDPVFTAGNVWTSNYASSANSKTFLKNSKKINKMSQLESMYFACTREFTPHWPFGTWASWKRGQKSSGGGAKLAPTMTHYRENLDFFWLYDTGHPTQD